MKSKFLFKLFKKKNNNHAAPNSKNELERSIKAIEEKINQTSNKILELEKREQELLESLFKQREQESLPDYFYHIDSEEVEKDNREIKPTGEIRARRRKQNTDDIKVEKDDILVIENSQNTGTMNKILSLEDQQKKLSSNLKQLQSEKYNLKFQLSNLEENKKPDKTCSLF